KLSETVATSSTMGTARPSLLRSMDLMYVRQVSQASTRTCSNSLAAKIGSFSLSSSPQLGHSTRRKFHSVAHSEHRRERLAPSPSGRSTATSGRDPQNGQREGELSTAAPGGSPDSADFAPATVGVHPARYSA